eukprot:TRINITY_DN8596_c0_g1_i2.p1 TRINITY_DN8596_c0_g1~~TRINITY_DN8596_c0_g1_i2.p1  ORF type:complete len:1483 (-),score=96.03 TRINITY_DN8596_c0_g1_i2:143-4231(-)
MFMLNAIKRGWKPLQHAPDDLKAKERFMLEAVQLDPTTVKYASRELKSNHKFMLEAVQAHAKALSVSNESKVTIHDHPMWYASPKLKADRAFVLEAVNTTNPLRYADRGFVWEAMAMPWASAELKQDTDFNFEVKAVVVKNAWLYASNGLKADKDFLLELAKGMQYAPDELKADIAFMLRVANVNADVLKYACPELKGFMREPAPTSPSSPVPILRSSWQPIPSSTLGQNEESLSLKYLACLGLEDQLASDLCCHFSWIPSSQDFLNCEQPDVAIVFDTMIRALIERNRRVSSTDCNNCFLSHLPPYQLSPTGFDANRTFLYLQQLFKDCMRRNTESGWLEIRGCNYHKLFPEVLMLFMVRIQLRFEWTTDDVTQHLLDEEEAVQIEIAERTMPTDDRDLTDLLERVSRGRQELNEWPPSTCVDYLEKKAQELEEELAMGKWVTPPEHLEHGSLPFSAHQLATMYSLACDIVRNFPTNDTQSSFQCALWRLRLLVIHKVKTISVNWNPSSHGNHDLTTGTTRRDMDPTHPDTGMYESVVTRWTQISTALLSQAAETALWLSTRQALARIANQRLNSGFRTLRHRISEMRVQAGLVNRALTRMEVENMLQTGQLERMRTTEVMEHVEALGDFLASAPPPAPARIEQIRKLLSGIRPELPLQIARRWGLNDVVQQWTPLSLSLRQLATMATGVLIALSANSDSDLDSRTVFTLIATVLYVSVLYIWFVVKPTSDLRTWEVDIDRQGTVGSTVRLELLSGEVVPRAVRLALKPDIASIDAQGFDPMLHAFLLGTRDSNSVVGRLRGDGGVIQHIWENIPKPDCVICSPIVSIGLTGTSRSSRAELHGEARLTMPHFAREDDNNLVLLKRTKSGVRVVGPTLKNPFDRSRKGLVSVVVNCFCDHFLGTIENQLWCQAVFEHPRKSTQASLLVRVGEKHLLKPYEVDGWNETFSRLADSGRYRVDRCVQIQRILLPGLEVENQHGRGTTSSQPPVCSDSGPPEYTKVSEYEYVEGQLRIGPVGDVLEKCFVLKVKPGTIWTRKVGIPHGLKIHFMDSEDPEGHTRRLACAHFEIGTKAIPEDHIRSLERRATFVAFCALFLCGVSYFYSKTTWRICTAVIALWTVGLPMLACYVYRNHWWLGSQPSWIRCVVVHCCHTFFDWTHPNEEHQCEPTAPSGRCGGNELSDDEMKFWYRSQRQPGLLAEWNISRARKARAYIVIVVCVLLVFVPVLPILLLWLLWVLLHKLVDGCSQCWCWCLGGQPRRRRRHTEMSRYLGEVRGAIAYAKELKRWISAQRCVALLWQRVGRPELHEWHYFTALITFWPRVIHKSRLRFILIPIWLAVLRQRRTPTQPPSNCPLIRLEDEL